MLSIPEKFIMMRSEEMDSAHMVHKGGANPPSCLMHHSVSWTKYTAKPAKKTRKSWHTEKYKQIEMTNELWKAELFGTADFFDNWTLDIWFPVNCLNGQLAPVQVSWTVSYIINCKMFSCQETKCSRHLITYLCCMTHFFCNCVVFVEKCDQ